VFTPASGRRKEFTATIRRAYAPLSLTRKTYGRSVGANAHPADILLTTKGSLADRGFIYPTSEE
jgi:hypothetical protein